MHINLLILRVNVQFGEECFSFNSSNKSSLIEIKKIILNGYFFQLIKIYTYPPWTILLYSKYLEWERVDVGLDETHIE